MHGFERLSVLLVEDSTFVRNMFMEILRALRVGKVTQASEGGEAIAIMRQISQNKHAAAVLGFDIILSDYVMSPINGAMLLRWVRQHEESPDRFVPFLMMSGAADSERVRETRELGVTEFVAKPFSVKSVLDHLVTAIERPRPYIYTRDYFGPDRRRQSRPWADLERRVLPDSEKEIVHSGSRLTKSNPTAKVFVFMLPNRLREKIAGGHRGPLQFDPAILQVAEAQLERMEGDYSEWVKGSLKALAEAHRRAMVDDIVKRAASVSMINRIAHELRGQGSTFGYPLITVFGKSLYECTSDLSEVSDPLLEFLKAHIDGINAVIRDKIKGNGGPLGGELITSLEATRKRLAPHTLSRQTIAEEL